MSVIGGQPTRWDCAVNVRVQEQVLPPGMQNADQADFRAGVFGVGCHLQQGLCAGVEQQIVKQALVIQRQHVEFVGDREDDMEIAGSQQFAFRIAAAGAAWSDD